MTAVKDSQNARLLKAFKANRRLTSLQVNQVIKGWRGAARVYDLKKEGHNIASNRINATQWEYIYTPEWEYADLD